MVRYRQEDEREGEVPLKESPLNGVAADYLQRARQSMTPPRDRPDFAVEMSHELGVDITHNTYWQWETGRVLIPAAAIYAAFRLSGLPVADAEAERTLGERLRRMEEELVAIRKGLSEGDGLPLKGRQP